MARPLYTGATSYVLRKGQRWNLKSTPNSKSSGVHGFLTEFSGLFSLSHCGTKTQGVPDMGAWAGDAITFWGIFTVLVR